MKKIAVLLTLFVLFSCSTSKPIQKNLTKKSEPSKTTKPTTSITPKPTVALESIKASKLSNYTVSTKYYPSRFKV